MRLALDSNLLIYAAGVNGLARKADTLAILEGLVEDTEVLIPAQALGELFTVLVRKGGLERTEARAIALDWAKTHDVIHTTAEVMRDAIDLASAHRLQVWDAVMLAAAAAADCTLLLSEDFQDGFAWRGVTVRNPFVTLA
jgi:predicted nucleic acid-binding protein